VLIQLPAQAQKLLIVSTAQEVDQEIRAEATVGIRRRVRQSGVARLAGGDCVFAGMKDERRAFRLVKADVKALTVAGRILLAEPSVKPAPA
jgi:hypothetical protein